MDRTLLDVFPNSLETICSVLSSATSMSESLDSWRQRPVLSTQLLLKAAVLVTAELKLLLKLPLRLLWFTRYRSVLLNTFWTFSEICGLFGLLALTPPLLLNSLLLMVDKVAVSRPPRELSLWRYFKWWLPCYKFLLMHIIIKLIVCFLKILIDVIF